MCFRESLTLFTMVGSGQKGPSTRVSKLCQHEHIYNTIWVTWQNLVGDVIDKKYDVITFFQKAFILRMLRVAIFPDIIKVYNHIY